MTFALPCGIKDAFPPRDRAMHKYCAGTVTVVGGSARYAHAPVIAGLGARAAGAGLVQLAVPDASRIAAAAVVPEATFMKLSATCTPPAADVAVAGMGLGTTAAAEAVVSRLLTGSFARLVLDADALNILAKRGSAKKGAGEAAAGRTLVITPHAGEAARLLGCSPAEIQSDRKSSATRLAEMYGAVVVLKGEGTIVARPDSDETWTCSAGNPFMALGGMGDLLAGMLGARWARLARLHGERSDCDPVSDAALAAKAAVWLHAAAADRLVGQTPPEEPCVVNVASAAASLRIECERS